MLPALQDSGLILPPMTSKRAGKRTLILDLDETLVHSQFKAGAHADIVLSINISNNPKNVAMQKVYAAKRPYCD